MTKYWGCYGVPGIYRKNEQESHIEMMKDLFF